MSITAAELIEFASANLPIDDASTTGGAIDLTRRPVFTDLASSGTVTIVSDGADTRVVTATGRNAAGSIVTDAITLNGTTPVNGVVTFERLHKVEAGSTSGTRTVTVTKTSGGASIGTIPVNETGFYSLFRNSASSTSGASTRYEKLFYKNTDSTLSLLSAQVTLTADPSSKIKIGVAAAVDGSTSVANRLAAPGGVSFVDDSVAQNVPGTDLAAGSAIGVWIEQDLAQNAAAVKSTFTLQLAGSTT